jgi:hypothetical protein
VANLTVRAISKQFHTNPSFGASCFLWLFWYDIPPALLTAAAALGILASRVGQVIVNLAEKQRKPLKNQGLSLFLVSLVSRNSRNPLILFVLNGGRDET